ncbi:MAG: hypothetical protein ACJ8AW_36925 [Rhodopila sp.]
MAKKAINYDNLTWSDQETKADPPPASAPGAATAPEEGRVGGAEGQLLKEVSWQTMLYLSFDAVRAIDELALAQSTLQHKVKRHDIICDALAGYLKGHGITVEVRAKPRKHRK